MELTDKNTVRRAIMPRPDDANKGTMGTLLSICGCYGMAGAAMLEASAALRMGIGLHKCALPKSIYPIAALKIPESVFLPLNENENGNEKLHKVKDEYIEYLQRQLDENNKYPNQSQ